MKNKKQKKKNQNKNESLSDSEITENIVKGRNAEAEGIICALEVFPGSSWDELFHFEGACENCFNRALAWLKSEGIIRFDGEYYYLIEGEEEYLEN